MLLENHQQQHTTLFELYLSGQYTIKKDLQKQLCHTFLEFYIDQD